jgi:hypothetical protein
VIAPQSASRDAAATKRVAEPTVPLPTLQAEPLRSADPRNVPRVRGIEAVHADNVGAACENDGMTKSELHELVDGLPDDSLDGAAVLLRSLTERRIDPDQAWFWTPDWLSGELETDREARSDDPGVVYEDAESFKAALHATRSQ